MAVTVQRQRFDAGYVSRLIEADPDTERDFVAYFGELLAIKLRTRLRFPDLIQDVAQETFLRVLRALRQNGIDDPEALGAFVNAVCNNVLFETYRHQARVGELADDRATPEPAVEEAMVDEERRHDVRCVLSEMPEKDRRVLRWLFFEEREKSEVCRSLDVDRDYLRVLIHRAKMRFRADFLKRSATKTAPATPLR